MFTSRPFFEGERIKEKEMRGFIRMHRSENPQKEEYLSADVRKSLFFVFFLLSLLTWGSRESTRVEGTILPVLHFLRERDPSGFCPILHLKTF